MQRAIGPRDRAATRSAARRVRRRRQSPGSIWWRRRSAIWAISACARWKRLPAPTSSPARTPASPASSPGTTASPPRSRPITSTMPREARPKILARLAAGEAVALVSDAGTPLISDPGYKLALAARDAGYVVTALPGRFGGVGGARRLRFADRPVFLRGFPAAQAGRAAKAHRGAFAAFPRPWCCSKAGRGSPPRSPISRKGSGRAPPRFAAS